MGRDVVSRQVLLISNSIRWISWLPGVCLEWIISALSDTEVWNVLFVLSFVGNPETTFCCFLTLLQNEKCGKKVRDVWLMTHSTLYVLSTHHLERPKDLLRQKYVFHHGCVCCLRRAAAVGIRNSRYGFVVLCCKGISDTDMNYAALVPSSITVTGRFDWKMVKWNSTLSLWGGVQGVWSRRVYRNTCRHVVYWYGCREQLLHTS